MTGYLIRVGLIGGEEFEIPSIEPVGNGDKITGNNKKGFDLIFFSFFFLIFLERVSNKRCVNSV